MDTIRLRMADFKDANGINAIIYSVNGVNSPLLEFSNPAHPIHEVRILRLFTGR
jgi:hypothetical protein